MAMNTVGRVEPLAFRFETGCIRHDRRTSRARRRGYKSNDIHDNPKTSNIASNHNAQQQPHQRPSAGSVVVVDAGRQGAKETVGEGHLLPVRVHAARWLHMKSLLPSMPFYSSLNGRLQSIGNALMAPAQTDPVQTTASLNKPIPDLPADTKVSYLAEGGANVVYRIILPDDVPSKISNQFRGKLLRVRKMIDSSVPYVETIKSFDIHIREMFDSNELVDQQLVRLPKGFILACNDQLRLEEASQTRPKSRHNVYLSTKEPFGLLITDMTPEPDSGDCLYEFKPKWLLQSPSAPSDAKRCRTCALRDMKNYDSGRDTRSFCPFDLVSDNFEDVLRATSLLKGTHSRARVAMFLHNNSTLLRLRKFQEKMNAVGLPGLNAPYQERALSMTLRDCTMYVKVPADENAPIEARLGDLDFKTGLGGKVQYWRDVETRLIEEGWYSGKRGGKGECSLLRNAAPVSPPSNGIIEDEGNGASISRNLNGRTSQVRRNQPQSYCSVSGASQGSPQKPEKPKHNGKSLAKVIYPTNGTIVKQA